MTASTADIAGAAARDTELLLTDFTSGTSDLGWYVVNDNVMGGRSEGAFVRNDGKMRFAGRTNTDGGGFSSIRTKAMELDLSNQSGIRLRVRGDGRRYTWRLTTDARWRGRQISYWADFATVDDTWISVDIPFSDFTPQFRGYQLNGPALDLASITGMGLMIYDKQDGSFELLLDNVLVYSDDGSFDLGQYRWSKRVLVLSAPAGNDNDLVNQKKAIFQTAAEFEDRDMLLVTLLENAASMAGDRRLNEGQAAAARAALGIRPGSFTLKLIGKDGSVKLSRESVTAMAEIYALIDSMPMRQTELSQRQ